jgi:kynureninase
VESDTDLWERAVASDRADPLAPFLERFVPLYPGVVYLDGNSLGRPPRDTLEHLTEVMAEEWGRGLIGSWDHWAELPFLVGDEIGIGLLGARPGEVLVSDSTSVNIYKLVMAALPARPGRRVLVIEEDNFPTDHYVLAGIARRHGLTVRTVPVDIDAGMQLSDLESRLDDEVALVCLSHVGYRSGALLDMAAITDLVHSVGALALWDLCHSVGVVPTDLTGAGADLAVGCTYKYLNAGPGAPAFLYVRAELGQSLEPPIWGWFGQVDQFAMEAAYRPRPGIGRFLVGTPPVPAIYAVRDGVRLTLEAGVDALRRKAMNLTDFVIYLADQWLVPLGFGVASPRQSGRRGAHVTLAHRRARQLRDELAALGVITDFRTPERIRVGPAPLACSFADVYTALIRLRDLAGA